MPERKVRILYPEVRKSESKDRVVTFVASDGSRDSAHTVLNQDGWDLSRYEKNSIVGYQHDVYGGWDNDPDKVIGKGRAYVETDSKGEKRLLIDVEFETPDINPLADKIYKKVCFGTLRAVSVGFLPKGKGSWGVGEEGPGQVRETYYFAGQELLEVSIVNIPANANAVRRGQNDADELEALRQEALEAEHQREVDEEAKHQREVDEEAKRQAEVDEAEKKVEADLRAEIEKTLTTARAALL